MKEQFLFLKANFKVSTIILITNLAIWLATEIAGGSTNGVILLRFGALNKELVTNGEIWRMISAAFVHIGLLHVLVNSYTLYQLGPFIENFFGASKLISTYVLTAITASFFSLLFTGNSISAGASGAIFGLIGLLLGNSWAKKAYTPELPIDERQLIPFVFYNLLLGFMVPGIDNWAHIGGLAGGIALGFIFDPAVSFDPSKFKSLASRILTKLSAAALFIATIFWLLSIWGISIIDWSR